MKSKEKIILTDADGVLLDWNTAFDNFMESEGFPRVPNTDHEYSIAARHGISHHQGQELVKKFNESWRVEHLEPFKDSVEYVTRLAHEGFRFIVVTSISDHPDAAIRRKINLVNLFGDIFDDIYCLPQGSSKHAALARWADTGYFWIEDHMRQAEAGHEVGLQTVLIRHPYNQHYSTDLFPIVSYHRPWEEIYKLVISHYKDNEIIDAWKKGQNIQYLVTLGYDDVWTDYTNPGPPQMDNGRLVWRIKPASKLVK